MALADVTDMPAGDIEKQLPALERASDIIKAATGQTIEAGSSVAVLLGTGSRFLHLRQRPVTALTSLVVEGVTWTADLHYLWDSEGRVTSLRGSWRRGVPVTVSYSHGYATIPDDLRRLTVEVATRLLAGGGTGVRSESVSAGPFSRSVTYAEAATLLTEADDLILDKYRTVLAP